MKEEKLKAFFENQVHAVVERAAVDQGSFLPYFAEHDPRDDEILALLAVSTMASGDFAPDARFPTPVEALAALPADLRSEICQEFRRHLKYCLNRTPSA
ncbi:MAG: hypothetical protein DMG21_06085 [Acidobacteria bacterium]|nr:MAG: hypothetical protein DMG21_06085 [Acidobacteriota bacterium]